jgi:hypothetical protein
MMKGAYAGPVTEGKAVVMVESVPSLRSDASAGSCPCVMERESTSGLNPSAMIITTCAASPGGLPADGRNFSFRLKRAAEARDSGQK